MFTLQHNLQLTEEHLIANMGVIHFLTLFFAICAFCLLSVRSSVVKKPNIIVIITDDMGWNDVSFYGSNEVPTPNIDALAFSGVILNRHYVLPTCTPSRSALLTGRHAIRLGLQGFPINVAEPRGLPLSEKILPEYLKELGYVTRLVGKWHMGYYTEKHTPARRGFDSFAGYYGGYLRYFDHVVTKNKHTGIDMHLDTPEKLEPYNNDQYFTDFITDHATRIIKSHDKQKPLYLHVAHAAAHASENVDPIEVKNMTEVNRTLGYIPDINRRRFAGTVTEMDKSVGEVVRALSDENMLNNSIIVFMSDNGAATRILSFPNYGSNHPFRGLKGTIHEGGVRVPAFVFSPLIKNPSRVSQDYFHITDWFPTLYKLAGGNLSNIGVDMDGIDQWASISGLQKTERTSMLLNIDEVIGAEGAIFNQFKLVRGTFKYPDYYGQSGEDYSPNYNVTRVMSSPAGKAVRSLTGFSVPSEDKIDEIRKESTVRCKISPNYPICRETCLFDIIEDPCETNDIADKNPEVVARLNEYIDSYRPVLMNQTNIYIDPAGYPDNFNGYWMPWLKEEFTPAKDRNKSIVWGPDVFCEGYPINDPRNCL